MSPGLSTWREHALAELSAAGHRQGQARLAVIDLLARQPCALTAAEIADELGRHGDRVGLATVYRTLELLADQKLVGRLDVGQGTARYEPMLPGGEHHHHLVCDRCGRVIPFDDDELETTIGRLASKVRFDVAEHDVVLHGACSSCRAVGSA
jgi:Fur family transcriptional regulator, ferric uptake regulator